MSRSKIESWFGASTWRCELPAGTTPAGTGMEKWQLEGFSSFRAWRLAKEKARQAAKKASPPPPLPPPPSEPMDVEELAAALPEAMELDDATLSMLNPSTQEDAQVSSPPQKRTLLQASAGELTEGGRNLLHRVEEATPRRTHVASAEYKTAAATPPGEDDEARERRRATERQRLRRARSEVERGLDEQVEAERAALAEKAALAAKQEVRRAAFFMRQARRGGKRLLWDEMGPSCRKAAREFGFIRRAWDRWTWKGVCLDGLGIPKDEWYWPWDGLPPPLKRAAVDLGYDSHTWKAEHFGGEKHDDGFGSRFLDMEDALLEQEREESDVCSDSELISPGLGRAICPEPPYQLSSYLQGLHIFKGGELISSGEWPSRTCRQVLNSSIYFT